MLKATESVGKSWERRESVIEKRRETTDRCGKKVEGSESVFKKGRELEKYIYYIYFLNANHSNMLDSGGIQPTFLWQLLFLVEDTQLYCAHIVALSQLSQFLCYSLWHLGQILDGRGKVVPVVT